MGIGVKQVTFSANEFYDTLWYPWHNVVHFVKKNLNLFPWWEE
jgi:hypothetical protein